MRLLKKVVGAGAGYLQLCSWVSGCVYKCMRRRTTLLTAACAVGLLTLALLLQWGVLCFDIQAWWYAHKICLEYAIGNAEGNMCAPLCNSSIHSHSCQNYYMGKQAVFAATWNSLPVIFKSPKSSVLAKAESLYWYDVDGFIHYPTEQEFNDMIHYNIMNAFNMTVSESFVKRLTLYHYNTGSSANLIQGTKNAWLLLQDNEYMTMQLYEKYNLFPKLIGLCGTFYAVQGLKIVSRMSHLLSTDDSLEEWKRRVHIAILIMEFLHALETKFPEPMYLCDVKLNHFGINDAFDKVTYLDLDAVHARSIADKLVGDGSECSHDSDCDYFDCRSRCNRTRKRCTEPVVNNNLQMVCEKIFVGWASSRTVLVPGLLLGHHAPSSLVELLKHCANPQHEVGLPRSPASLQFHDKIYNILTSLRTEHANRSP